MTNREKLKRAVISAIHQLPYEEAVRKEFVKGCHFVSKKGLGHCLSIPGLGSNGWYDRTEAGEVVITEDVKRIIGLPITIGRVMQAYSNFKINSFEKFELIIDASGTLGFVNSDGTHEWIVGKDGSQIRWTLTKEGKELTDDDQTDETIDRLLEILEAKKQP